MLKVVRELFGGAYEKFPQDTKVTFLPSSILYCQEPYRAETTTLLILGNLTTDPALRPWGSLKLFRTSIHGLGLQDFKLNPVLSVSERGRVFFFFSMMRGGDLWRGHLSS